MQQDAGHFVLKILERSGDSFSSWRRDVKLALLKAHIMSRLERPQKRVDDPRSAIPELRAAPLASSEGSTSPWWLSNGTGPARRDENILRRLISDTPYAGILREVRVAAGEGDIFLYAAGNEELSEHSH